MRTFEILYKEAMFYSEVDRKVGGDTLKHWFADLPLEEQEQLKNGMSKITQEIISLFNHSMGKFLEKLELGIKK